MLRHACGLALANAGHDTPSLQAYLGRNIQHTVRHTKLAPDRFKHFGTTETSLMGCILPMLIVRCSVPYLA